jgi:Tfp pilus assembly protein PilZ
LCGWQSETAVNVGDDVVVGAEVVRRATELVAVGVVVWAATEAAKSRTVVGRTERIIEGIIKDTKYAR